MNDLEMTQWSEQETAVLDIAMRLFSERGVRGTSMADLCKAARVPCQTLYKMFGSKDDVLRALVMHHTDGVIADIRERLETIPDLAAQLDLVFEKMVVESFDLADTNPNAHALIEGANTASSVEKELSSDRFCAVIKDVLEPHAEKLSNNRITSGELSRVVLRSAKRAVTTARDRDHLMMQLASLRRLCLAATGAHERAIR